jgi:hypothetical protein
MLVLVLGILCVSGLFTLLLFRILEERMADFKEELLEIAIVGVGPNGPVIRDEDFSFHLTDLERRVGFNPNFSD